jgi:hypothetical protein
MPQNWQLLFDNFGTKITATVSCFLSQNQSCFSLSVALQNRWMGDGTGHASGSGGLLRLETSRASNSQSSLGGDASTGGARDIIADAASSES